MSISYADALLKVRSRLQVTSTLTLSDADILLTINSVYSQWWRMFYDHASGLIGSATCSMATGAGWAEVSTADIVEVLAVYASTNSALEPGVASTFPLEKINADEMRYLWRSFTDGVSPAAGLPAVPANGVPAMYSIEFFQDSAKWTLTVYPKCSATYYFPMTVRIPPAALTSGNFTAYVCLDDEMVAICAVSALRLLTNVGKQNDQGLIQALASEIPQEMQVMAFTPKTESIR